MNRNQQEFDSDKKLFTALAARLAVLALIVAGVWIADSVRRTFFYEPPEEGSWLIVDGSFADHPTEPVDILEATEPPVKETEATEKDPFAETEQAAFRPTTVHVPSNCVLMPQEASALRSGKLLRLDNEHAYSGYEGEFVDFSGSAGGYDVRFGELETLPCVVDAMDKMAAGYLASTGLHNLIVYSTTSACHVEGSAYPDELPDRAPGYSIDLAYLDEEKRIVPMYTHDIWLESNAYRYGFVYSYTEADENVTGVGDAPYHLRYVGKVHAGLMQEQGLTLAAYLDSLPEHSTEDPLFYELDGQTYSVYYVPKSPLGSTDVPVPKNGNYDISGDNDKGFVVVAEGKIES